MGVWSNLRRALADVLGPPSFAGTPYPTGGVEAPAQLQEELGGTGTFNFGGFIRGEEFNPQLDSLTGIKNLDEMRRSDAQVHAALEVVKMPIRTADYEVDPADPDDPESMRQAEFIRWCLFEGMTTTWDDLIRQALLMLDFGFMLFEKVWQVQEDGEWADHIVLKRLAPRPPKTLWQWFTDEDGALISVKQLAVKAGTYQFLDIPADKLVRFTFQQEGDNFQGISMLRSAYPHWLMKKQFYVIDAIRATRFGVGIPRAKLLAGYKPTVEDRAAIALMLQGLSSHQHAYLIQPPQVDIDILMPQGVQGGAQLLPSINHQNEQITRNILAQFLDMGGKSQGGSKALGASAMDFFLNAIESISNQICDVINKQVIRDLIDMNYEVGGKYPTLRPVGIQETDVKSMAAAAQALAAAGLLTPDKKTENTFRNLMNLPEVPDEDDALQDGAMGQVPAPTTPPAGAPSGTGAAPAGTSGSPAAPSVPGGHPAKPATAAPTPAVSTAKKPGVAKPATAAPAAAKPATAQPAAATPATAAPTEAAPATTQPAEAVLRPGLQAPPIDTSEVHVEPPPTQPGYPGRPVEGVAGRPKSTPAISQSPTNHDVARTNSYQTTPANTTWATAQPAVSSVREPVNASTKVSNTIPATAHMARSTTNASSGAADEEGHTSNGKAVPATSQPRAATPATGRATTAIPASEIQRHTHQTALALSGRLKSDRQPDRWTTQNGVTLWRTPTPLEMEVLDLHETPRRLDTARTALLGMLRNVREEQILRIAAAVAHAKGSTSNLTPPLVGKMTSDILKAMQTTYQYGYNKVKDELAKQRSQSRRFAELNKLIDVEGLVSLLSHAETDQEKFEQLEAAFGLVNEYVQNLQAEEGLDKADLGEKIEKVQGLYDRFALIKSIGKNGRDYSSDLHDIAGELQNITKDVRGLGTGLVSGAAKTKVPKALLASAEVSAQSAADQLMSSARGEALRLQRAGWEQDEIEDALKIHMGQLSDATISKIASSETNESFSLGRKAAASDFKDQIQKAVYSAILDNAVCDVCEALDGEEFDVDSDEYEENMPPNSNCKGGDACRCTYIYVLDPETSTDGDDRGLADRQFYDGQPRAEHGKFGAGKLNTDVPKTKGERGMAGMVSQIAKPDGGFTYHAVTGHQPTTGYALSIFKGRERVLDVKTLTPSDLVKFARDNHDILSQKGNYFGAWHNPADGKVYLDISKVVSTPQQAEALGRAHNQLAYFDLAGGHSVEITGGQKHRESAILRVRHEKTTSLPHGSGDGRSVVQRSVGAVSADDRARADTARNRRGEEGLRPVRLADWDEDKHPRGHGGKFAPGAHQNEKQANGAVVRPQTGGHDARGRSDVSAARHPETSAERDANPTGEAFATDRAGRPDPNLTIQREADAYNAAHGLPPINHDYVEVNQERAGRIADAYDAMPMDDSANPRVAESYKALANEVNQQWDAAVAAGMKFEPAPPGTDPYKTSFDVAKDVRDNRHLAFYEGGQPNQFMSAIDPKTGYSINDKFRAIHDYFGHAAGGFGFGPRGEENAWRAHAQMFSEAARGALTTETRGQNSWVNFGRQNYDKDGNYKNIPPDQRPFAVQKTGLLPKEFWSIPK